MYEIHTCFPYACEPCLWQEERCIYRSLSHTVSVMPANADGANLIIAGCIPKLLLARPSTHQRHRLAYTRLLHPVSEMQRVRVYVYACGRK